MCISFARRVQLLALSCVCYLVPLTLAADPTPAAAGKPVKGAAPLAAPAATETVAKQVQLAPCAIGSHVLAHRLLPAEYELADGNAAIIMLRVPCERGALAGIYNELRSYAEFPPDAPEWQRLAADDLLPQSVVNDFHVAACQRSAEWNYFSYGESLQAIRLPDVQSLRLPLAFGLPVTARWQMAHGELDQALRATRAGLGCARHMARTPFIITQLVAAVSARAQFDSLQWWVARADAPNLYWSLAALPQPLLFPREAADFEGAFVEHTVPEVDRIDEPRDEDQWDDLLYRTACALLPQENLDEDAVDLVVSGFSPGAREKLARLPGRDADQVAAMCDAEVVYRYYVEDSRRVMQQFAAYAALRPAQAAPHLVELQEQFADFNTTFGQLGFMPSPVYLGAVWRVDRELALWRVVESLRHHLATHQGAWPENLDAISDLPAVVDPFTDRAFEYRRSDTGALLAAPAWYYQQPRIELHLTLAP